MRIRRLRVRSLWLDGGRGFRWGELMSGSVTRLNCDKCGTRDAMAPVDVHVFSPPVVVLGRCVLHPAGVGLLIVSLLIFQSFARQYESAPMMAVRGATAARTTRSRDGAERRDCSRRSTSPYVRAVRCLTL